MDFHTGPIQQRTSTEMGLDLVPARAVEPSDSPLAALAVCEEKRKMAGVSFCTPEIPPTQSLKKTLPVFPRVSLDYIAGSSWF